MRYKLIGLAACLMFALLSSATPRAAEIQLGTSGGIYTVPVQINGSITAQFLVDPGAGVTVIPTSVLRHLVLAGTVTEDDIVGIGTAELADSSLYLTARVKLRELRVGNTIVRDVVAAVSPGLSQPLLGQSFLRRFAAVTFDNRRHVLILSEDAAVPAPPYPAAAAAIPYSYYPAPAPLSGGSNGTSAGAYGYNPAFGR